MKKEKFVFRAHRLVMVSAWQGDLVVALWIDTVLVGAWRGDAFRWACEALKPLVDDMVLTIRCSSPKAKKAWAKIGTAQETLRKFVKEMKP